MGIVGDRPEDGLRVSLERPREGGPPWVYRGEVVMPTGRFETHAVVTADGATTVTVTAGGGGDERLAERLAHRVKLLLRSAWKHAHADQSPPPSRLVRWRTET